MDDTAIANMALTAIGTRSSIASLSEGSPEANAVNLIYASTRDTLLAKYRWSFSRRQKSLVVLKAASGTPENPNGAFPVPPRPWRYSYAWPADCIVCRFLLPIEAVNALPGVPIQSGGAVISAVTATRQRIPYLPAGDVDSGGNDIRCILTNQPQAELVYTAAVKNANIFGPLFVTALVGRLAQQLVIPLSGDKAMAGMAIKVGEQAEAVAEAGDGNQQLDTNDHLPDFIAARGYPADDAAGDWG